MAFAHNNETYVHVWGCSADATASGSGSSGNAGGGSSWNGNFLDLQRGGISVSTQESLHSASDLPVRQVDFVFFATPPANQYGACFAVGNAASVGVLTTGLRANPPRVSGTGSTATTSGYTLPDLPHIGDLVLVHVMTRGGVTAATPTDSSGEPYTLVSVINGPGGVNQYLWKRVALHNDVAFVVSSVLSGSTAYRITTALLSTPSSTFVYKMDERSFAQPGGNPFVTRWTAAAHGPTETDLAGVGALLLDGAVDLDVIPRVTLEGTAPLLLSGSVDVTGIPITPLAGEGALLLDGSTDLHTSFDRNLAGTGPLILGGEAPLDVFGGVPVIEGSGDLLATGRVRMSAPTPQPPIPVPAITQVLGCGVYEVLAFTRGGDEVVGSLEFDAVQWGRMLDATSAARLEINGVSNLGALERCCDLLGSLNPWEHELAVYRQVPGSQQKRRVWMGPITRMRFPNESVVIEALDLSGWLQRRTLHANHNYVQTDLIEMWVGWVEDAMSVDNSPGLFPHVLGLSGILADRLTTIVEHNYAADPIAEIATTGIDWTTIDRVMQAGPVLPQPAFDAIDSLPLLLDEAFRVAPEIIVDGMSGANCWFSNGGGSILGVPIVGEYGPAFPSAPDHVAQPAAPDYAAIEDQYGRIEQVVSETRILDQPSIDANAKTRYELTKNPVPYITGGELLPTAPLPISLIIPGALLRVKLNRACKPIDLVMRIQQLDVQANSDGSESVDIQLEPIGTIANG